MAKDGRLHCVLSGSGSCVSPAKSSDFVPSAQVTKNEEARMSAEDISPLSLKIFYVAFGLSQICGIAFLGLLINLKIGALQSESVYFWHPLFASLGLIILQGESFLIYRILRQVRKPVTKVVHAALHFAAFASVFAALVLIFKSTGKFEIPSGTHGKLGLLSAILFLIQYVVAFTAFLAPGAAISIRAKLLPIHVFGGMFIFLLSCTTVLLKLGGPYGDFQTTSMCILFALLVGVCVSFTDFRRRPIPVDNVDLNIN